VRARKLIIIVLGFVLLVTPALGVIGALTKSAPTTTTTSPGVVSIPTTTNPAAWGQVTQPSPAGVFGKAPTLVVPAGPAPTSPENIDLITGTGPAATTGQTLEVQYVLGTYSTHGVVQSSWTSQPYSFTLGGQVIAGWNQGVVGMKVGGRRELIIPPSLGYGSASPTTGIAANDTLVFIVDLLKISK